MSRQQQVGPSDNEHALGVRRSDIIAAADAPWLAEALAQREIEMLPRVDACYTQLCALPRPRRRALQRHLARARDLTEILDGWWQRGAARAVQRRLARSLAGAALLLALVAGPADAATITVNTNIPAINDGDGKCSLIEAIVNANTDDNALHPDCPAGSGADIIVLAKKTHAIVAPDNSDFGQAVGLPTIASDITIEGHGATISRRGKAPFGLIAVGPAGILTLKNVTLTGGNAESTGGAITNYGTATIQDSIISRNTVVDPIGFGGGIASYGPLTIVHSTITGNKAGSGAGIAHIAYDPGAQLSITNSVISKNTATSLGGGGLLHYSYDPAGTVTIENSTISGNKSLLNPAGGGILTAGYGTVTIENSTISGNKATRTVRALVGPDAAGGGIASETTLILRNSTVSGNTAMPARGGYVNGGGIANYGDLTVENSTISANQASGTDGAGGGIYDGGYTVTLRRSLISGNKAVLGPEAYLYSGSTYTVDAFNLFGAKNNPGIMGFTQGASDVVPGLTVTSAKILGPLANNGGPTKTHILKPGSPALNVIPLADPGCTGTDQRGIARPQGAGCDIGAVERQ